MGDKGPHEIFPTTGSISKFQMPFDSSVREFSEQGKKFDLDVTVDVTGHVNVKFKM